MKLPVSVGKELQHFSLVDYVVDVLHLRHTLLLQHFEGTRSIIYFVECLVDFAEITDTRDLEHVKVCDFWLPPLWSLTESSLSGRKRTSSQCSPKLCYAAIGWHFLGSLAAVEFLV